jgi:murein DD-endopeptidase MepM/ murein hydrolase activator NlpD
MNAELTYLARWRTLRSHLKLWDLPLAIPLDRQLSISADFGDRRSYGGMVSGYHSGVDYRAWTGLPVVAPADGVVVMAETLQARGNAVLLDHGWGLVTGYWHLSQIDVEVGDWVRRGETFARVGNTGLSTGSHLHWEVWVNGVSVDGKQWLAGDCFAGVGLPPLDEAWLHELVPCEAEDYAEE